MGLLSSCVHKVSQKRNLVNNRLYQRQTVRCQSNGNRASSVCDLPAPAAQTSAVGTACSRLPWPAVLPGRPHGPIILASLACLSLYSPTPPVIFWRRQPNQSTLVLSTVWATTAVSSPAPCCSLRRPRRHPPPWCSGRSMVNDVHPMAVVLLQPLVFLPQPPKAGPVGSHAPASRGRLYCRGGLAVPILLPPLARPSLHPPTPSVIPLLRLPRLRVVPFLGLTVVHRPSALGATLSTWSTIDFDQKSTVRGEADSWVHGGSKEVPPYYAQNNYSST